MYILNITICFLAISTIAHAAGSSKVAPASFTGIIPSAASAEPKKVSVIHQFIGAARRVVALAFSSSAIKVACEERHTTALMTAVLAKENKLVETLATSPNLINIQDVDGMTAVMHAAKNDNSAALDILIAHNADVERVSTKENRTALHFAAQAADYQAIQALVATEAKVDVVDSMGNTPLMLTIMAIKNPNARYKRCVALIANGMNLEQCNRRGETALWLAAEVHHEQLIKHLMNKGAKLDTCNKDGTSALEVAALTGMATAVIKRILQQETRLDAKRCDDTHKEARPAFCDDQLGTARAPSA